MTAAPETESLSPGLYIVATPIGNLGDITLRSIETLRRCDAIACEDTRVTGKLLKHLGISKPLWRYDDHSSQSDRERLLTALENKAVVLVSDAGTPLISDPGYKLVSEARRRDLSVTSLPGPSAVATALSLSGLPTDRFLFAGFLPQKPKARRDVLEELGKIRTTLVFFETGPRLIDSLNEIAELFPEREVGVARELTKLFEEYISGTAEEIIQYFKQHAPKGEIVLLVGPPGSVDIEETEVIRILTELLAKYKPAKAVSEVARITGIDRKELYRKALEIKNP